MFNITTIKNGIKNAGMTAAALALVAGIGFGSAPSASASSLTASRLATTSVVQAQEGKINVVVSFDRPTTTPQQATVLVLDTNGQVVAKGLTGSSGQVTFKVVEGEYKVQVSADNFATETFELKVSPNTTTSAKVTLYSISDR
jgi:hypothetical protein